MKATKNIPKIEELDFTPLPKSAVNEEKMRPSQSYWQDAMRRFCKNKRAMLAALSLMLMLALCILGPFIWRVDPNLQQLNEALQSPSWSFQGRSAQVIADPDNSDRPTFIPHPGELSEAVKELKTVGLASTVQIHISWQALRGAHSFKVFRNEYPPLNRATLGVPLAEVRGLEYRDALKLELIDYYYSVVALDQNGQESDLYSTYQVNVEQAFSLSEAKRHGHDVKVGDHVMLSAHPLGTDSLGRDLLARIMKGGQVSLYIGIIAPFIYIILGILIGGISGYLGGKIDSLIMRFTDFVIALPFLLFMILFKVAAGNASENSINIILFSLILLSWPGSARLIRGQVLQLREEPYIQAARLLGGSPLYIIIRHLLPNTLGVILVSLSFAIPSCIFTEAFLSFIGMGVVLPDTSWGAMCNEGVKLMITYPYLLIVPSIFISITVLAFNVLGDGLRDALDAKMRSKE
ncbi:ABC transporter permease [Lentisphaera profundi]|uniref:ABC transporter permease n=1 Tax=Lentisphaera profundi TaxID=1658616 RepID=A0ABY7VX35_9BACT|nr:ABC transporter permease [Lentisphaera profundi]WDE96628.1 ABC transporter permease [Lentisphaera profundi]